MAKINILSDEVRNRIKAGEVIDRPYSAVKEMVENSIDAGATEIEIRIERGGKDLIEITDNGCGIEKDDMRAAFFAHATSKISTLEDIDDIHTLGFRGEALASISSISKVELVSAVEGQEANKVFCDGEYIGKVEPTVAPKGTKITVTNFFFNTPVRYKFMRSDKKEESDITAYVTRFILCRPEISFKYYVDGKLTLQSYGGGLDEALAQVYGAKTLGECFKISADRNDIKIHGFIGNQNFSKPNKTYETLFLNGRYINNAIIQSAISNAYGAYLMKRNYPFYVLFVEMGCDLVDVNVHPNKTDVRFADNQLVYGTVYKVISSILDGTAKAAEYVVNDDNTAMPNVVQTSLYSAEFKQEEKVYDSDFSGVVGIEKYVKQPTQKKEENKPAEAFDYTPYENYEENSHQLKGDTLDGFFGKGTNAYSADELPFCSGLHDPFKINEKEQFEKKIKADQEQILFKQCKWCGMLFNTYLMYEMCDEVYIIDQHAAHERLIYDVLIEKIRTRNVTRQGMLVPYIFVVNPEEKRFIDDNIDAIYRVGFGLDPFGSNSFRVNEIPADLQGIDLKNFFDELLAGVNELKAIKLEDILKEKIAQTACKHAVKGGEILTEQERDKLFSMLDGNLGLKCPHGRPVCVKLTKTEIEKMFKRKV